jgi:uncharacterized protein involved in exopolysaccharide biosynthesis
MSSSRGQSASFKTLLTACNRRKWQAGTIFLSVIGLALAIALFYPRSYQSEAKVFVRKGRETVSLDPTATTGQTTTLLDSGASEINSVVAMLKSRILAEKVVEQLGPEQVMAKDSADSAGETKEGDGASLVQSIMSLLPTIDPVSAEDRAIRHIEKGLDVAAERDSSVIVVRYVDHSPQKAQLIASTLLDAYQQEHMRVNRTRGSKEFFDDQAVMMREKWHSAAEQLRALKDEAGLASIDTHRQLLESRLSGVQDKLADAETQLATAVGKAERLEQLVEALPADKVTEREDGHANVASDGMRQQLYDLEMKELDLSARFKDDHPLLKAVRDQLADARKILGTQGTQRMLTKTALNLERETLHLSLLQQQAEAAAFEAQAASLAKEQTQLVADMKLLNQHETHITNLQHEVDLNAESYRAYAQNLEQTRIDSALESDKISNVNIYQSASLESRPVSPRKGIVLALGFILATISSLAYVVARDHTDTSLRTPEDVEGELNVPVLVSIPHSRRHNALLFTN